MPCRPPLPAGLVACLALATCLFAAAPAGAVVGGEPLAIERVPWYADLGCGGTLVAPDRILTAAHCVGGISLAERGAVVLAGKVRPVAGVALHPGWRHANGPSNYRDDVALLMLAERVEDVAPAALGGAPAPAMTIVGQGFVNAPGSGRPESENFSPGLRQAVLRPISDAACARAYRRARGNAGERFDGARMICAIDPDGRAPLSSGCNGDSGGPLMAGSFDAPRVLGVVSYGGARCGADHLPSVFAEVERYRGFILSPRPVLAPEPQGVPAVARRGRRLTCATPSFTNRPSKVAVSWLRMRRGPSKVVGHGRRRTLRRADRGALMSCRAEGSNAGGHTAAVSRAVRVPR